MAKEKPKVNFAKYCAKCCFNPANIEATNHETTECEYILTSAFANADGSCQGFRGYVTSSEAVAKAKKQSSIHV
ncbi:MAG TPA: hypothetical protein VK254_03490 [Candidatus Bathyarchaeia archaeon]|nr:hypothetical protein [Candidatus Bathyarchaeia archaeon]